MRIEEDVEFPNHTVLDGRFRIRSVLGEGGLGCVYLAEDLKLNHDVALKILIPRYRGRAVREQRLLNEAIFARRVPEHPALPRFYGSGRLHDLGGCPYVLWEVVQGRDLNAALILSRRLPTLTAMQWARQLADALCTIHRAGVVHRDVTVTNVFIEQPDDDVSRVKLIDLSHAACIPQSSIDNRRLTREFEIPGAHRFMPPEQTLAFPPHPKMDVFSFGIVLHEMLTGHNPFEHVRDRETYIEMQRAGLLQIPRIDRRAYPDVIESMVELVAGCTQNDLTTRLEMTEVRRRLDQELANVPMLLMTGSPSNNAIAAKKFSTPITMDTSETWEKSPRSHEFAKGNFVRSPVVPSEAIASTEQMATDPLLSVQSYPQRILITIAVIAATMILLTLAVMTFLRPVDAGITIPTPTTSPTGLIPNKTSIEEAQPRVEPKPELIPRSTKVAKPAIVTTIDSDASNPKDPSNTVQPRHKREPSQRERTNKLAYQTDECRRTVIAAVNAEKTGAWNRLELLTRKKRCFEELHQWAKLRTHALLETDRFTECSTLARTFKDPFLMKYGQICRTQEHRK